MNLKPLLNRVVVGEMKIASLEFKGKKYKGDYSDDEPLYGKVIAIGPGIFTDGKFETLRVKVGDFIMFDCMLGIDFEHNGNIVKIIEEHDILLVVEK